MFQMVGRGEINQAMRMFNRLVRPYRQLPQFDHFVIRGIVLIVFHQVFVSLFADHRG